MMLARAVMRGSAGAGGASPPAGYSAWYDASDTATITDTAGIVDTWADKGGNSSMLLTTHGNAGGPATGTVTLNSLNTIDFSNANAMRTSGNVQVLDATTGHFTAFFVVRPDDTSTLAYFATLDAATRGPQVLRVNGGNMQVLRIANNAGSNVVRTVSAAAPTAGTWAIITVTLDASDLSLDIDGGASGSTGATGGAAEPSQLGIGGEADSIFNVLDGGIAEIIFYPSVLSAGDITDALSYLATKWGL